MTKVEAIACVMNNNDGIANWNIIYNEIKTFYPDIDKSSEWKAGIRGVLYREIKNAGMFKKISNGLFALENYEENKLLIESQTSTTGECLIKTRIYQDKLRKYALKQLRCCPITGINDRRLLIVSHIKPWAFSSNTERLDINNVILLSPLFDKLFDNGLITFSEDKKIHISNELSVSNCKRIGISQGQCVTNFPLNEKRILYLEYHRNKIFIK